MPVDILDDFNETYYTFNDVQFMPLYSRVGSRSEVSLTSDFGFFKLPLPIISANMKDITGPKMVVEMFQNGGLGILHRFSNEDTLEKSIEYAVNEFKTSMKGIKDLNPDPRIDLAYHVGVSIGVNEADKRRLEALYAAGAKLICIDIAHGHCLKMKNMLEYIREIYEDDNLYVIAGNIASVQAAKDLLEWGANCVKVGIGPGEQCETRKNTGVGVPQLSAVKNIREAFPKAHIISDGGIKNNGDIAKALKYSNAVMVGSMLSGTSETPGDVFKNKQGQFYKVFGGSASAENKTKSGMANAFVEGVVSEVPFKGHAKYILRQAKENLQSAFSYQDSFTLPEFQQKAVLVRISGGGKQESKI